MSRQFSDVVRHLFAKNVSIPISETVFEYFIDSQTKQDLSFKHWNENLTEFHYTKSLSYFQLLVPTVDTIRYEALLRLLYLKNKPVFFTGETGVGKSVVISAFLSKLKEEGEIEPVQMSFSAQSSSLRTQQTIESKLERRKGKVLYEAVGGKKLVLFIDDVNMPAVEKFGAQPPIELLRQYLDFGGFYDRQKFIFKEIWNSMLISAAAPPGGGRNDLTPRFIRHFHIFNLPEPSKNTLMRIFGSLLGGFLTESGFQEGVRKAVEPAVVSTIDVYQRIMGTLKPTPAKFHYVFNLRDVSKVFQGLLMTSPFSINSAEQMARCWAHESCRVFHDRLINESDKRWFTEMLIELITRWFKVNVTHSDLFESSPLIWSDITNLEKAVPTYMELTDRKKLVAFLSSKLEEFNTSPVSKMHLVFFEEAVLHILRISRILRQPRGNILLIGVGGSGKQSLTKLVTYILEYKPASIELSKNYGMDQFREDVKKMMDVTGVQGKNLTFIMTDTQIANEGFLEDINSVLNTGEITNLFAVDEVEKIIEDLRPEVVDKMKLPDSKDVIYTTFVQRVRDRLHIVLCMSPVGDLLRIRCRMFPSLVNCSTIDWFGKWPQEALLSVSTQFLKEIKASDEQKASLSRMCMEIHSSVEDSGERMFHELRRKTYTTPKSYLDLISLYMAQLELKRGESQKARVRLENGLSKLRKTRETVRELKEKLKEMAPELEVQKKKTEEYFEQMQRETKSTEVIKESVARENDIIEAQMIECKAKNDDAERDLAEAMPALEGAMRALASLDKKDITVVKSFIAPPPAVCMVMEAVCILLEEKPDWPTAKVVLSQMDFIEKLQKYNKDNIPEGILRKLKTYVNRDEFEPEFVGSKALAAKSLCMWCIAMSKYSEVIKVVRPKREKVKAMNAKLEADIARLREKQNELQAVEDKVNRLRQECDDTQEKVAQLESDIQTTQLRLERAEQLIDLLADEGIRWESTLDDLTKSSEKIIGNVFLSAASISYLGPFTGSYRSELSTLWTTRCQENGIPCAEEFSLEKIMGKPVEIREWNIAGLPSDKVSIENGILATVSQRWPLMIDPQMQAHSWVKAMERENELKIMKLVRKDEGKAEEKSAKESKEMMRLLEACISNGKPLLIEDVTEQLDPSIDPVLRKNTFKTQDGRVLLRLGDQDVNFDPHFRLYLTTKLPNPHYLPEICIKVNVINFTVTFAGLEEQLLGDVVKQERPEVERQKNEIIVSMASDKKLLEETQNKILRLIAESTGNILDDVVLIETMQTSKATSRDIEKRVQDAVIVETTINETRDQYRTVSIRGSILYFVVSDLAGIDPMYQYSLAYINRIFNLSIESSPPKDSIPERCEVLIDNITRNIYTNVCRGLFESHKAIFSFLIASSIFRKSGEIEPVAWSFLLRGAGIVDKAKQMKSPDGMLFPANSWDLATVLDAQLPSFQGFTQHVSKNIAQWREFVAGDVVEDPMPGDWSHKIDHFGKLLLIKVVKPEKLMFALADYVKNSLGSFFTESPPATMETLYSDSEARIPIIFVLSQGADPTNSLQKFARDKGYLDRTEIISLGQGQGPKAQECLERAKNSGNWVVLQNCHLAKSWMPALEKIVEAFREEKNINPSFRLFLTSMPADYFPVSVLQNGLKQTTEPPRGIRSNLKRSYGELTEEQISDCTKPEQWRKLLFGLCFFHAVVQERRKFGPLGFNIRYEFNDSDLETSITNLKMFLDEQEEIPWDAMIYLTGHINYGGRVTDDWDRKCLLAILKKYYVADILEDGYVFSDSGTYYAIKDGDLSDYRDYIDALPQSDSPEIFGMHNNANISYQTQESEKILNTVLSVQPRIATGSGGRSNDEIVLDLSKDICERLPERLDQSTGHPDLFIPAEYGLIPSLSTVLLQEVERFNRLLGVMNRTLVDLEKAIKGEVVMSQELDDMYFAVLNAQVPPNWKKVAYPSLKPLSSWIQDLNERVSFMRTWLLQGNPSCYWLSGFYFPQAFITGTLQTFSRRYQQPIDHISFSFNVLDHFKEEVESAAYDGVYVYGLFLEGARWDMDEKLILEQQPGELYCQMPVIHFLPVVDYESPPEDYQCPVYKTSVRAGELSTTGQSTNFILSVDLQTEDPPDSWTLKGTALLCQLNE